MLCHGADSSLNAALRKSRIFILATGGSNFRGSQLCWPSLRGYGPKKGLGCTG